MVVVIAAVDVAFFKDRFVARLLANLGIVVGLLAPCWRLLTE